MQLSIETSKGKSENIQVSDDIFACRFNEPLIHQVVTAYLAAARQGSHAQKNRSAVSGGGKKPWKQKGTGRARAGTTRSPIWRKGGVTFAAQPQDYSQKVNKKAYRVAMKSILSELIRQERLILVDSFSVDGPKTKEIIKKLKGLELTKALIVSDTVDENLYLATRNLNQIEVCDVPGVNPVNLISFDKVLMTVPALRKFEEMFK